MHDSCVRQSVEVKQLWSSGKTSRCHREDAGSIPASCSPVALIVEQRDHARNPGVASEWDLSVAVTHVPAGYAVRFRTAPFCILLQIKTHVDETCKDHISAGPVLVRAGGC